jgi:GTP-binding protein
MPDRLLDRTHRTPYSLRPAMSFIDEAVITVKAGDGGDGSAAMRREDGVPHGGPSGGDGGDGGSIIVHVDSGMSSLLDFKYRRSYKAERGEHGRNKDQYGAAGPNLVIKVPRGTVIYNHETNTEIVDLAEDGATFVLAKGGIGGRGNIHFKTAWNQAPTKFEPGTPGQAFTIRLELKLLADVGLLGFPNVGKSTFISHVSRARPKVADYPFTTLVPNLGVVQLSDERNFVIADIPGLIEGASEGAGLGHQFLRHVERCSVLLHILDDTFTTGPERSPLADFDIINRELAQYAPGLANTPQIVALNKTDALDEEQIAAVKAQFAERKIELFTISAATGHGIAPVLEKLWGHLASARRR